MRTTSIRQLLREPESTTLDVKRDQYAFTKATDDLKSEIIKDIISFANTPRTTDAHILLGVTEHKGRPATITGITSHPDDAHLQQLINSKTNRPVHFTYQAITIDNKEIGIITIPPQERPTYLKHDYGKLRANTVYLRRGSSTATATPDEIIQLRTSVPTLDLQFANPAERTQHGRHLALASTVLHTPKKIPDLTAKVDILNGLFNPDYYREFIRYAVFDQLTTPIGIAITNTSSTTATDVHLHLTIPDPHVTLSLDAPPLPSQLATTDTPKAKKAPKRAITLERTSIAWHLTGTIPKIRPQQTQYLRELIYIGATTTMTLTIAATIHADNLPEPITSTLAVDITTAQRTATLIEALAIYNLD